MVHRLLTSHSKGCQGGIADVRKVMVERRTAILADLGLLGLAAVVMQGLLLYYLGQDARNGVLGLSALTCASLYAFAAGAAAFAGERETGTLRLLDILPVDRRVVWAARSPLRS